MRTMVAGSLKAQCLAVRAGVGEGKWRQPANAEESEANQAGEADLPAVNEASAGARRVAMSKVRLSGKSPGAPQDQEERARG